MAKLFRPRTIGTEWRRDFEILGLPVVMLVRYGEEAFEFACSRVERHPLKLMKQAAAVLCGFACDERYRTRVIELKEALAVKEDQYARLAAGLIERGLEAAAPANDP
jgi:hypothetical protein